METTTQFVSGKTYSARSICDSECVFSIAIASRTKKTITTSEGKRLKVAVRDGVEIVKPMGNYSMAPVIRASV